MGLNSCKALFCSEVRLRSCVGGWHKFFCRIMNSGKLSLGLKVGVGVIGTTHYVLRREPLYHKLQYSKVAKFDVAAAVLGVIVGAFVVYLSLCTLGSAGADLSDLTVLVWYSLVWANIFYFYFIGFKSCICSVYQFFVPFTWVKEVCLSVFFFLKKRK